MSFIRTLWTRWFGEPLAQIEANSLAYRLSPAGQRLDGKTITVILAAACCLTLLYYAEHPTRIQGTVGWVVRNIFGDGSAQEARALITGWGANQYSRMMYREINAIIAYAVIPGLIIKLWFRERLIDYGVGIRGVLSDWPIYLIFALIMLPLVWWFSGEERFQVVYPFFHINSRAELGAEFFRWELFYAFQFISLEFFFRGFIVHGTKHRFGAYSVFVMVIPYCMLHFQKPLPECIGSILAGVGLGVLSLATRSVWPGAGLHIVVAWGMDLGCLIRRGLIG